MQATAQLCNGHVLAMPTDRDNINRGPSSNPILPALKKVSLLEEHLQYDWVDNRKVDRSMLAYSTHVKQLPEHDHPSHEGRQWMMLPHLNRSHTTTEQFRSPLDMTVLCTDRDVTPPLQSPYRPVSDRTTSMSHSPFQSASKRYNSGMTERTSSQSGLGCLATTRNGVHQTETEISSISIVPFPPPAVDIQTVICDNKHDKKSDPKRKNSKRHFMGKGALPPIPKGKPKPKPNSASPSEEGSTSPIRQLRLRKGKATLLQGSSAPINTKDVDEVLKVNLDTFATPHSGQKPRPSNELWEKAAQASGISNFQGGISKVDPEKKLVLKKQRKSFTPRVIKGATQKKNITLKKEDSVNDEEREPQIKSVLKKKGVAYTDKSVQFGEELEFVRIVSKIEYPWYNESSSEDEEEEEEDDDDDEEETEEDSQNSSSLSSSSSSEDEDEKKRKQLKKKTKTKTKRKRCVKNSKAIMVDEVGQQGMHKPPLTQTGNIEDSCDQTIIVQPTDVDCKYTMPRNNSSDVCETTGAEVDGAPTTPTETKTDVEPSGILDHDACETPVTDKVLCDEVSTEKSPVTQIDQTCSELEKSASRVIAYFQPGH